MADKYTSKEFSLGSVTGWTSTGVNWGSEGEDKPITSVTNTPIISLGIRETFLYRQMMKVHGAEPDEKIAEHLGATLSGGPQESKYAMMAGTVKVYWEHNPKYFHNKLTIEYVNATGYKLSYYKVYNDEFLVSAQTGMVEYAMAIDFVSASKVFCQYANGSSKDLIQIAMINCFNHAMKDSLDYDRFLSEVGNLVNAQSPSIGGQYSISNTNPASYVTATNVDVETIKLSRTAKGLPGMGIRVEFNHTQGMCKCPAPFSSAQLYEWVIHLNDIDKVSRDKIADWMDWLHDQGLVNLEFGSGEPPAFRTAGELYEASQTAAWYDEPIASEVAQLAKGEKVILSPETEQWLKEMDAIKDDED